MDERIIKFRVGVFVLVTLIITATLIALFGKWPRPFEEKITIHVHFTDAPGVMKSTPVRKSGILIGEVTDVQFADDGGVIVTCEIVKEAPISKDDEVMIGGSLLGDASINFVARKKQIPPEQRLQGGETLRGTAAGDPLQIVRDLQPALAEMIASVTSTSGEMGSLSRRLRELIDANEESLSRALAKTEGTLDAIRSAAAKLDDIFGDPALREDLKRGFHELPLVLQESRQAFAGLQDTLALANRNLTNLEGFTRPLGQRGDAMFQKLDSGAEKLELLLDELLVFSEQLNNRQGSIGRLIHDPELYESIRSAAANVDQLTRELRPVLHNVNVFTDKIARDPGSIGVRGVFQQRTGIK
jgi:phospholipid/cholesterol/gamma-HCH transport system substrate-binding protein